MRTAIFYATKHGTTEKVALRVQELIGGDDTQIFNLKSNGSIDLNSFDRVIVGGSIHAGSIQGRVKKFCQSNMVELLTKRVGLFMCGMNDKEYEQEFKAAFPELLRNHAVSCKVVGGEFLFNRMNFVERILIRKISGINHTISRLDNTNIQELVDELK